MTRTDKPEAHEVTTIDPSRDIVTMINVFTLKPGSQQAFVVAQTGEYKRLRGKIAGSLAANLHRGLGGSKAVNYAQFRSAEDLRTWQESDLMKEHLPVIRPHVERAQPGLYRAVEAVARGSRIAHIEVAPGRVALIALMFAPAEGSGGLDALIAAQREVAEKLLGELPALRSVILHKAMERPGGPGSFPLGPNAPNLAIYAQLDGAEAARALVEHPTYRASFTTEHPNIQQAESEVYEVSYVQNEATSRAAREDP